MITTISDALAIMSVEDLTAACSTLDAEWSSRFAPLEDLLETKVLSSDVASIELHMDEVNSWRVKVVAQLSLASALVERSKSSAFLPAKSKDMTELDRDAFRRKLSGGFVAWKELLEGLIDCIDERVNICKKFLYTEAEGFKRSRRDV
jgi:hypothetical protein